MSQRGPRHSVSVAAALIDGDRVLAVRRRDNGHWEPPGGVLELGESIEEGLVREVQEETGLHVEPEALTGVYKNLSAGIVALMFRCRITRGELSANDEVDNWAWLTAEELEDRMDEAFAVRLLDALAAPATPPVRSHDGVALFRG